METKNFEAFQGDLTMDGYDASVSRKIQHAVLHLVKGAEWAVSPPQMDPTDPGFYTGNLRMDPIHFWQVVGKVLALAHTGYPEFFERNGLCRGPPLQR